MADVYAPETVTREELDALPGATVVSFGTNWCSICQGAQPLIDEAFRGHETLRHLKIEDGKGRRLGRTFGVKLWPTLIVMRDGVELARVVRPNSAREVQAVLAHVAD